MPADTSTHTHMLKLTERIEVAQGTLEFRFEKPAGLSFKAGQFMELVLIDPPETDAEGNARALSIACSPDDPFLAFATRVRDTAFKRTMRSVPIGTVVGCDGPFGDLTLHNNASRPAVLLAGGIGITPFRSFVRWASHKGLDHRILLFYSNRRPEDAAFLDELTQIESQNKNFTFVPTMSHMGDSSASWTGATGFIDFDLIKKHLPAPGTDGLSTPMFYIAGPPAMVEAMRAMLNAGGIDDDDIRAEDFGGY